MATGVVKEKKERKEEKEKEAKASLHLSSVPLFSIPFNVVFWKSETFCFLAHSKLHCNHLMYLSAEYRAGSVVG